MHSWTLDLSVQSPCVDSVESRCTDSVVNDRGGFRLGARAPSPEPYGSGIVFLSRRRDRNTTLRGADRDRTDDLRLAKPALSQLSYSPEGLSFPSAFAGGPSHRALSTLGRESAVGQGRLELPTSRLSGVCSNHLSYWPDESSAPPSA